MIQVDPSTQVPGRTPDRETPRATPAPHSIFRASAIQRYARNQERSVLPRFASTGTFRWLWVVFVILVVIGIVVARRSVPTYITGTARFVKPEEGGNRASDPLCALFSVRPEDASALQIGQALRVGPDSSGAFWIGGIASVGQNAVFARIDPHPGRPAPPTDPDREYRATVQVGSRRLASFLPGIGRIRR